MTGHDTKEKWASWTLPIFKLGHSGHCLAGPSCPLYLSSWQNV